MAINRIPGTEKDDQLGLEFNNGDYQALKSVVKMWGFKDVESAIRFGVAILIKGADTKQIHVKDSSGEKVTIEPADSLLKKTDSDGDKETTE